MKFSEIYGHQELKDTLIKSVRDNHVAHALLFSGKPGSANLAIALAFAQYVNCTDPSQDSCGQCTSCSKYEKMIHPDLMSIYPSYSVPSKEKEALKVTLNKSFREFVIANPYRGHSDWVRFVNAEKKQCIISVEEGRSIAKNVSMKAFEAKYKVVIVWEPELMNQACANSILKILEEPPAKTLFLLVSNDFEKNLTTILSRAQMVNVPLFKEQDIEGFLEDKHFVSSKRAQQIAKYADGSMGKAIKMISDEVDTGTEVFVEWMRTSYKAELATLVGMADQFSKYSRAEQMALLNHGLDLSREVMLHNFEVEELKRVNEQDAKFLVGFAKLFDGQKIQEYSDLLNEAIYHIERNLNVKILFLDLSLKIAKVLRRK